MNRDGSVPSDNPVIAGTRNKVYSLGHRNPQGIAFRPGSNQVYAIEHGPNVNDEINLLVPGGNYGWPCYTGAGQANQPATCNNAPASNYRNPLWSSGGSTIATSGGAFVAGGQWADYSGHLFVSTLKGATSDGSGSMPPARLSTRRPRTSTTRGADCARWSQPRRAALRHDLQWQRRPRHPDQPHHAGRAAQSPLTDTPRPPL